MQELYQPPQSPRCPRMTALCLTACLETGLVPGARCHEAQQTPTSTGNTFLEFGCLFKDVYIRDGLAVLSNSGTVVTISIGM